jgi:hypothetical protein
MSPLFAWILELLAAGQRPVMRLVAPKPYDRAAAERLEREWIARLRAEGAPLLNVREAGR